MGDGLGTAAREVLVGDGMGIKDGEGILTLGRDVDVTAVLQRRGGNEEDVLLFDEGLEPIGCVLIELAHRVPQPQTGRADPLPVSCGLMRRMTASEGQSDIELGRSGVLHALKRSSPNATYPDRH
jgi:hypothetical protein